MHFKDLDIERIYRAFSPAKEITNPRLFAGRSEEVREGILALLNRGSMIAVLGLRGVGKSSIARQIGLIAQGDTKLPRMLGHDRLLPKKGFNYIVHYYQSDGFIKTIPDLLKRILFGDEDNLSLFSLTKAGERRLEEFKKIVQTDGSLGAFGVKIGASGKEEKTFKPYISDDLVQQFRHLLGTIQKDNQDKTGLLIMVDEFDTIADKEGFASLVKACSSDFVKFAIIGIATNIGELMSDHQSIGRKAEIIPVPLMEQNELHQILKRGEFVVDDAILFSARAATAITERSEGFPYFTHLLGKEAMVLAFARGSSQVTSKDITVLSQRITDGKLRTIYEDLYHNAVGSSPQREILLIHFADCPTDEISSERIYAEAKGMEVSNPSQLMKQLTTPDSPGAAPVLVKVRNRCYRFSDPVFKIYVRFRKCIFDSKN